MQYLLYHFYCAILLLLLLKINHSLYYETMSSRDVWSKTFKSNFQLLSRHTSKYFNVNHVLQLLSWLLIFYQVGKNPGVGGQS